MTQDEQNRDWPDPERSAKLMKTLLDHYAKHHEIVLKKLMFAKEATAQSINEVKETFDRLKTERDNTNITDFKDFEVMWQNIIDLFVNAGATEDELFKIEEVIEKIPKDIKVYYKQLIQQDQTFLTLVNSLNSDAYKKAKNAVLKVQTYPNPMSGLTEDDYEVHHEETEMVQAFRMFPKSTKH